MAVVAIHVNGPALVYFRLGGRGALHQLGISEDGVDIEVTPHDQPVMTDAAGPALPADIQDMGEDATIRVALSAYDLDALAAIRRRGNSPAEGFSGNRGQLMGASGNFFQLLISSAHDEPWRFFCCILRGPRHVKPATRYSVQRLNFYAWALVGAGGSSAGAILYDHRFS